MRSVVYPFRFAPANSLELMYSLRSVNKWIPDVQDAYLVGTDKPDWCFCPLIHHVQTGKLAVVNTLQKLKTACEDPRITDSFIWMMDDVYLIGRMPDYDFYMKYPPYRERDVHHLGIRLVIDELDRRKLGMLKDFELHTPFIFDKQKALQLLNEIDTNLPYSFRTLYGNIHMKDAVGIRDVKIVHWDPPRKDEWAFSSSDITIDNPAFKIWAAASFPNKSQWEL